jgi:UDP-hydrolysing UDP-N-acetyl-D-glucosamine 2-epimerase
MAKRKIAVVVGSRANYSSIKSVMREVQRRDDLELLLFVGASAVLERFGNVSRLIEEDGFKITEKFHMLIEGESPVTMAMSTGLGLIELPNLFENYRPDIVVTVGDRFETMSTAIAASYMNIPLAHTMGGEISGTIDESIRHAVTKLAHIHFPANQAAADRIKAMGELEDNIFVTGCPRIDLVKELLEENRDGKGIDENHFWNKYRGVGGSFSLSEHKFLLVSQHPVTTEFGSNREHIEETLMALLELQMPTIMIWPNADAGSDEISKGIRTFREKYNPKWLHLFKNLPIDIYVKLMDICACMIGNSSSAIREGAFIGVPAMNIGSRQDARERGMNVIDVPYDRNRILEAINKQVNTGKYDPDHLYGDGFAGERIADILSKIDVNVQKQLVIQYVSK